MSKRLAIVLLTACGSATAVKPAEPVGYANRMQAAQEHERRAVVQDQLARESPVKQYSCGDRVLSDQTMSGGQPIVQATPCWNVEQESVQHHRDMAARERAQARTERREATRLVEKSVAACAGIPEAEREHSPFAHRKDISEVLPHVVGGQLRGVRVVFKPVGALTADWLERDIACHRAEVAVLGEVPESLADDPTLLDGATVTVGHEGDRLTVLVETESPDLAEIALAQAEGKPVTNPPQTASR
jgi:hypothetical protein